MKIKTKEDYIKEMERKKLLFSGKTAKPEKAKHKKIYKSRNITIPAIPEHSASRSKAEYKNQESRMRNRGKRNETKNSQKIEN